MVYYRKYRPQTIAELDSAALRETLTAVLSRKEFPHAFLLTGPKGLGKTSTARIIAKVVNCEHTDGIEPDNTCEQCVSITNGTNMDVLEIDGASNRGIDEIRDLRDKVKLAPSRAKKKVYIIDEVHMLTTEAFNALLKTIEEPPAHVMFIFCTTEPQKIPETILSRCFHIMYPKATTEDIVGALKRVREGEKLTNVADEALREIARMADGGFRDATKILEELVLVAGDKKIDRDFIDSYYKTTNVQVSLEAFLADLYERNTTAALHIVQQLVDQGTDIKWFISQVLTRLNDILLARLGVAGDIAHYVANNRFEITDMQTLVALLSESYQQAKYSPIPQLPLELAVVAWCGGTQETENSKQETTAFVEESGKHTMDTLLKKEKNLKVQQILHGTPKKEEKPKDTTVSQEEMSDKREKTAAFMENLIYKVKPLNHSVAGVLRGCGLKRLDDGQVVLETSFKFHKERLEEAKTKDILEQAVKEMTGKNLKVVIELK